MGVKSPVIVLQWMGKEDSESHNMMATLSFWFVSRDGLSMALGPHKAPQAVFTTPHTCSVLPPFMVCYLGVGFVLVTTTGEKGPTGAAMCLLLRTSMWWFKAKLLRNWTWISCYFHFISPHFFHNLGGPGGLMVDPRGRKFAYPWPRSNAWENIESTSSMHNIMFTG